MKMVTVTCFRLFLSPIISFGLLPPSAWSLSAPPTKRVFRNKFRFVPYGEKLQNDDDKNTPTISCDGLVPGSTLQLTHWTANETPDHLYADTSTEIALEFASHRLASENDNSYYANFDSAEVCNNHYDTDGVLSVYACLDPKNAYNKYKNLMISAAEAGDFGEWTSDEGVKLDCSLCSILEDECDDDEEMAYESALAQIPAMLADFQKTGGESYRHLWNDRFAEVVRCWEAIQKGAISIECHPDSRLVVVQEKTGQQNGCSCYALHRALKELKLDGLSGNTAAMRVLMVKEKVSSEFDEEKSTYRYTYEKPGYGWVKRLRDRQPVPDTDGAALAEFLDHHFDTTAAWVGGGGGLTSICRTAGYIETPPTQVAAALVDLDAEACQS